MVVKLDPTLLHIPHMVPQRHEGPFWGKGGLIGPSKINTILVELRCKLL